MTSSIAVISDIHGNSWALEAVIKDIHNRGINKIINLGDSIYGPLDPLGTIAILIENDVISIKGNEDKIILDYPKSNSINPIIELIKESAFSTIINWLQDQPDEIKYNKDIYCCHGSPSSNCEYLIESVETNFLAIKSIDELKQELSNISQPIILCGHSHIPNVVELDNKIIVNPGSVGLQAYLDDIPFSHKMENYSAHARYSIISFFENDINVEQIILSYDYEMPAIIAEKNGYPDWSKWIKFGRV